MPRSWQSIKQQRLAETFRGQYGRLCVLVARALIRGVNEVHVIESARGYGESTHPACVAIRAQWAITNRANLDCQTRGVGLDVLVPLANEARAAVEQEFMYRLPSFAR